jgi:phthiocerol/phenolphthiocerol synthesis type-I polyketide synthase C
MARQVVITGYSFRFSGQNDAGFWDDLLNGRDLITKVEPGRWTEKNYLHPDKTHPGFSYTSSAGSIGDVSGFDAGFFGISPREAAAMDPQQRLLLELAWEAFENSGIRPSSVRSADGGVYIGLSSYDYALRYADDLTVVDSFFATGNTGSIASNRLSYFFDLHGPSMTIDTACSSSLVAFHQACRSIVSGETDFALAGGVSLHLHPYGFVAFSKASMLSAKGRCRVFDASADGYVRAEGGGIFILKEYEKAVADGDPILAVVAGTGVNTDGRKSGLTVPNPKAQAALVTSTCAQAGISPSDIDYMEMHGTGTAVGDPVETRAVGESIGRQRVKGHPLPVGSVKSNLGHLEPASGVPGLVKALLCIQHRTIPATIGLENPNPNIDFQEWNLEPVTRNRALDPKKKITIGVNSFGFGGANAHVILQSFHSENKKNPVHITKNPERIQETVPPLVISARSAGGLQQLAAEYAGFLDSVNTGEYYHIAYSTAFHRDRHRHRAAFFGTCVEEIRTRLNEFSGNPETVSSSVVSLTAPRHPMGPAFIYSGNGAHWFEMGKNLLDDPVFLETVREIDGLFQKYADFSLESELAGKNGTGRFEYTEIAQPALFALQAGVTRMFEHQGIQPTVVAGHSVGEIAAAWAAGILSLSDAVRVIYFRSKLQGGTKGLGQMTAVALGEADTRALLGTTGLEGLLVIAGVNSARGVTLAGDSRALSRFETVLADQRVRYKRLDLDYAFHSPAMDPIAPVIKKALASLQPAGETIPFFSTVTGTRLDGDFLDAEYWWRNLREPVRFEAAVKAILDRGETLFMEIGPHNILSGYINEAIRGAGIEAQVFATLKRNQGERDQVRHAARQAMTAGADTAWQRFFPFPGRFVPLPNYPWQKEHLWLSPSPESRSLLESRHIHPLLGHPVTRHDLTWENHLDTRRFPMLADHVVGGAPVFPGAGYVELALAAALAWRTEDAVVAIEELEILNPLLLSDTILKKIRVTVLPDDAGIEIVSRDYGGDEPWTRNARGRILAGSPGKILALTRPPSLPSRAPDFFSKDHYSLIRATGLDYGPAFQCIQHGWINRNSITAILEIPESICGEIETLHIHPALLDSAFQLSIQFLKQNLDTYPDMAFVPVKIGKIFFDTTAALPYLVSATLVSATSHSLKMEFTFFDNKGNTLAVVQNARLQAMPMGRSRQSHCELIRCQVIPRPNIWTVTPAPLTPEKLYTGMADMAARDFGSETDRCYAEEIEPLLDTLCRQFLFETFEQLAWDGTALPRETIQACQDDTPEIALFIDHLIREAEADDMLSSQGTGWVIHPHQEDAETAREIWNILVTEYPEHFFIIDMAGRAGLHLTSILTGKKTFEDIFPTGTSSCVPLSHIIGENRRHKLGRIIQDMIRRSLAVLPSGRRFSLMEIGMNAPLFVKDVFLAMDTDRCDYLFAADTREALENVSFLRERFPGFESRLMAVSTEDENQVNSAAGHHLILLSLDFNNLSRSLLALDYAGSQLGPGGTLILISQHPSFWIDFTLGARPGWFRKRAGGWESCQRSARFWQRQLAERGLVSPDPIELSKGSLQDIFLLTAHPGENRCVTAYRPAGVSRNWIILTDRKNRTSGLLQSLVKQMEARRDHVRCVPVEQIEDYRTLLSETVRESGRIDGIIHLAGFLTSIDHTEPQEPDWASQQAYRCAVAARAAQACEETGTDTTLWIVTNGAARHLIPAGGTSPEQSVYPIPADSALYGFARTMMNEASHLTVRSLDITVPLNGMESLADAVMGELEVTDDEQEVMLDHMGERFVPRLRVEPPEGELAPAAPASRTAGDPFIQLGFQFPGQLRNLQWESQPQKPLDKDEVEIQVHATGLNFRDVMYTLGLLSDEAVESGFSGASLGLEFAGVILRTGEACSRLSPGERVLGFGPSCFADRITTTADAVHPIPAGMSFEAAASIPVAFLTVYYSLKHLARIKERESVLIHGGAGGIGVAAIQTARFLGAEIHATAGTKQKQDFLRLLGVNHVYDSRSYDFAEEIMLQTNGRGVDIVLNSLAGEAINRNLQILRPFGRFLELGKRDFYENTRIGLHPFRNNISYFGIDLDQLMKQDPALTGRLFSEVMEMFARGTLHPLPCHVFEAEDVIDAFRYMQQARHIGKIVVTCRNTLQPRVRPSESEHRFVFEAGSTWLVTGGLSGFGLKTAEWLADKGVRHLVLISRSGPASSEAGQALDRLKNKGVHVLALSCDVTDKSALENLMETIDTDMPPLRGIVHAAAVIEDGLVTGLDQEQIYRVLAPKILGGQHLHQLTLDRDLDFFILFSSATTFFGNPGQAGYVGANCWLESLAQYRRSVGLPATCISWGAIGDAGFLARHPEIKEALQKRMGGSAISSDTALDHLERLLAADRSGVGLMDLDWQALSRFLPGSQNPRFSEIARRSDGNGHEEDRTRDIFQLMSELSEEEFLTLLMEKLRAELGEILRMPPHKIDPVASLTDMGMDSLMGVELAAALESRFDIRLPVVALRDSRTLTRLAQTVFDRIKGQGDQKKPGGPVDMKQQIQILSDQHGVDTSREEAERLVSRLEGIRQDRSIIDSP